MADTAFVTRAGASFDVWRRIAGARIRADWQYRASFFLFLLSQTLIAGLEILAIAAIFSQVDELGGWSGPEVALIYGLGGTAFGIADLFVSPVEMASKHIKAGSFDLFLHRPAPALLQLCATEFALRRAGKLLQATVVLVIGLVVAPVDWSVESAMLVPVSIASGTVIFSSTWVATTSIVFWTIDGQETANAFVYGGRTMSQYPFDVFTTVLRRIMTFVVPLAFAGYLPAARMLDRHEPLGMPSAVAWAAPLVALTVGVAAWLVWGYAVRRYRSTGS